MAIAGAFISTAIDARGYDPEARKLSWIWVGGAEGARNVLSTIASSMITVAGVTFSITIVALAQASSQFGPRLLRTFMRDTGNQIVLGTFLSTYIYCLLVLRVVHDLDENRFVPHVSVTIALALSVAGLAVLIYFIHHICDSIQAENLVAMVGRELVAAIQALPEGNGRAETPSGGERRAETGSAFEFAVEAPTSGYLQAADNDALMKIATENGARLDLPRNAGDFITEGLPLVCSNRELPAETRRAVQKAFKIGRRRTPTQDLDHQAHQLVEIAVRALSPGINDPFTAMACIDWLGAAVAQAMRHDFPAGVIADGEGNARVTFKAPTFEQLLGAALNPIRQHGAIHLSVAIRLLEVFGRLAEQAPPAVRMSIAAHAENTYLQAAAAMNNDSDRSALRAVMEDFRRKSGA